MARMSNDLIYGEYPSKAFKTMFDKEPIISKR